MKIAAFSDTHGQHGKLVLPDSPVDVAIFAGDFTAIDGIKEYQSFIKWFDRFPAELKILVAGNHDFICQNRPQLIKDALRKTDIVYLEDQKLTWKGFNFYASPFTPRFNDWAFMKPRTSKELHRHWQNIPEDTDILITHGPAFGILDKTLDGNHVGCELLAVEIPKIKQLKAHIFGHVHEGYGSKDVFHNVACCDHKNTLVNPITYLEIEET